MDRRGLRPVGKLLLLSIRDIDGLDGPRNLVEVVIKD